MQENDDWTTIDAVAIQNMEICNSIIVTPETNVKFVNKIIVKHAEY